MADPAHKVFLPPHVVRRDFLPDALVAELLAYVMANEARFTPSRVGYGDDAKVDPSHRISLALRDLGPFEARLRDILLPLAGALTAALKITPFETKRMELELAAHGDGAFLNEHTDIHRAGADPRATLRVLSGVYYFHRQPKAFSGGQLRLHELLPGGGDAHHVDVEPAHNSCVFFPAWMPHEVLRVSCPSRRFADSRFAINCWFRKAV